MVEDIVLSNKEGKTYNVKNNSKIDLPEIKYVVGNSFGCFIALRSIKYLQKVKKAILFAPALTYGKTEEPSGFKESGLKFLEYVKRSRPFTYRLDDEKKWRDFYDGKMNICIDRQINTGLEEVVCVVGSNDGSFNLDELKRNYSKIINQCIGKEVLSKLIIVEGGKHSISTLLNDEVIDELNKLK